MIIKLWSCKKCFKSLCCPLTEDVDSPASSTREAAAAAGVGGVGTDKKKGGRKRKGKKETEKSEMKVPPMKIKLIGRSGETDSPIFFAESLGEVSANKRTKTTQLLWCLHYEIMLGDV